MTHDLLTLAARAHEDEYLRIVDTVFTADRGVPCMRAAVLALADALEKSGALGAWVTANHLREIAGQS